VIRVAIVDDHPMTRRGVEGILAAADGLVVTQTSATPDALDPHTLDVVVHDLYLAEETPSLVSIAELSARTRVLVMSAYSKPVDVLACVRAGARGYVTKDASPEMVIRTVETVGAGGFAMSPQLADILQAAIAQEVTGQTLESHGRQASAPQSILAPLGPRESETLDLIAQGFTHHQIARRMGVTKATVDTYVERVRKKLQVGNKADLTRAALVRRSHGQDGTG
jgi:two-component system, NarL family, nitrate/nitrite response regulator NarL